MTALKIAFLPFLLSLWAIVLPFAAFAAELHVAPTGDNTNSGSQAAPLCTIQRAADLAMPGDTITVHEGTYRESIAPPRGGESDAKRIVYRAAAGEKVEIKGSEPVKNWVKVQEDVWKTTLPNSSFGEFIPYADLIRGDWFDPKGRAHHTGAVYLDGQWLAEAANLDDVLKSGAGEPLWFAKVEKDETTIWARFKNANPNERLTEINVRRTVFYPKKPGVNYLTVSGFAMRHAATPWAPPTAEQPGLIGTHWSKGWIIENNKISHSICSGIALGKYGDQWDNKSADSAEGYVETIKRAWANGWNKETVGGHIVRNNEISHCEQAGIVGSLGAAFSTVTDNDIHDIHVRRLFTGAEMAGIKFHGAVDVRIAGNRIYRTCLGLWLDWMAQGTIVSGNLFHDNDHDAFVEVDHGPFLFENNLLLSKMSLIINAHGGAYVHNLLAGGMDIYAYDARLTPYLKPHSTEMGALHDNPGGDDRFYNNLFAGPADLDKYGEPRTPVTMEGNVFLKGAKPSRHEKNPLVKPEIDPSIKLVEKADECYLEMTFDKSWLAEGKRKVVDTATLGNTIISKAAFENPDGSPLKIDRDYFGKPRSESNPAVGPFENSGEGRILLKVK
jgi:alpha-N-arabinofuranosidase